MSALPGLVCKPQPHTSSLKSWRSCSSPCSFRIFYGISPQSISLLAVNALSMGFLVFRRPSTRPAKAAAVRLHWDDLQGLWGGEIPTWLSRVPYDERKNEIGRGWTISVCEGTVEWQGWIVAVLLRCRAVECCVRLQKALKWIAGEGLWLFGNTTGLSACTLLAYVITVCLKMAEHPKSFCRVFLCFPLPEAQAGVPLALGQRGPALSPPASSAVEWQAVIKRL